MAKQHRMALLTFTSLIMFFDQFFGFIKLESVNLMDIALVIIALGCVVTCWRRLVHIYQLKNGALAEKAND
jgi:cytochrome b subunit of formate dehydrogenase